MLGLLDEASTPCPSRSSNGDDTLDRSWRDGSGSFDETANLNFNTEIKAPILTKTKPRRRTPAVSSFQIHDDHEEKPAPSINKRRRENGAILEPSNRKSSLLAQPAQRFRPKVSFAPSSLSTNLRRQKEPESNIKNTELDAVKNKNLLMQINGEEQEVALKKDVRRDTVYIPTEDTAVASVFMGLFSPLKSQTMNNNNGQIPKDTEIGSLQARVARKRHAKKSLTSSARRAPLQPSAKIAQEASIRVDVAGKNGGKENIPPGSVLVDSKNKGHEHELPIFEQPKINKANTSRVGGSRAEGVISADSKNKIRPTRPVNGIQRAVLGEKSNAKPATFDRSQKGISAVKTKPKNGEQFLASSRKSTLSNPVSRYKTNMISSNVALPNIKARKLNEEFPLLTEDISKPALYEDNWLSHQEILITQLLNGLFEQTDSHASSDDPTTLRHELLDHYQDNSFTLLYERVQASLLYGAMSIPKDVLSRNSRLKQDLGMKRKVLGFWTQTYDLRALRAALETVFGRRISSQDIDGSPYETTKNILKKRLESFLHTFLLRNEDMGQRATEAQGREADTAGRAYRRTILRSIMIIVLLDKARMCPGTTLPHLFVTSSPQKSSAAVLQAFARLLLPSSGDIIKSLGHLDCQVSYEQHQLQEYDYRISNLAVDVRDGVRLTRIVELLLYSYVHPELEHITTVTLPGGAALSCVSEEQWPLSPRLKLPCTSRAVKLFNVQVALNALASAGTGELVHDVSAEDIVDGHREKTIALLWGLVSKWGLPGLVDWDDVQQEISRLKGKAVSQCWYEQISSQDWFTGTELDERVSDCTVLLKQWASLLAQLKGLRLDNLSSNFADGRVYEKIVDEYQGYILGNVEVGTLSSRLQALGCSSQFANLITPNNSTTSHIFDGEFTIGALAFLCSRLLSASKRGRATMVVQRAWRQILARRDAYRLNMARDIARQCAAVVQTRDQVVWAKDVIVRAWRQMKARRQVKGGRNSRSRQRHE